MKRHERSIYCRLRREVTTTNTIRVEIPLSWTHEARQACHELLTVEKLMHAASIYWNPIYKEYCLNYIQGQRQEQEGQDVDEIASQFKPQPYTWSGYPATTEAKETMPTTETKGEKPMTSTKAALKKETSTKGTAPKAVKKTHYKLAVLWSALRLYIGKPEITPSISSGNSKLGEIPSFSLLPGVTCSKEACRHCLQEGCYAVKNAFRAGYNPDRNTTLSAWARNTAAAKQHLPALEAFLNAYFSSISAPRFFRIHASGDFFSVEYAEMWRRVIKRHNGTRFLFFTKQWEIMRKVDFLGIENLSPVLSGWTGCDVPQDLISAGYRVAWCDDGIETRIPADAIECPGNCETCGMCWSLYTLRRDTFFHKH